MTRPQQNDRPAVLITGASTGIGQACVVELDRRGFRVLAGVRQQDDAERLTEQASDWLVPLVLDVTQSDTIAAAAQKVNEVVGEPGLSGLVNNAGIVVAGPLEWIPPERLRHQFEVNVVGLMAVTQAMLPMMRTARGRIVNMGSVSGRIAVPLLGPYAASKHALEALSDSLRVELRRWGISVSIVEPGSVKTPIWRKSREAADQLADRLPHGDTSLYQDDIDAVRASIERIAAKAMPVDRVVRAVVHALTARRPKTRYPVGVDARCGIPLTKFLPDRLRDRFVMKELGLR